MDAGTASDHPARGWETRPTVSIVIPCHNYGRFLAEAVESALGQTRPPDEVIIVDDGSTDDSLAVAGRYAHHPAVRIISQEQQGAIATFNVGVRSSTGSFFLILSADDRLDLRYLERTLPLLAAHPEAGYVYTAYRMFGARHRVRSAPRYDAALLARRPYIVATVLMRRAAFDGTGGFSTSMEGGQEDWDFFVTLASHGWHGIALPEVLFHYRQHSTASRNALTFRRWLGVRTRIYRGHRPLYRLPLPLFLALVTLDHQWLKVKAVPRAAMRKLGREGTRTGGHARVCLIGSGNPDHQARLEGHRRALAQHVPVATIQPGASAAPGAPRRSLTGTALAATYRRAALYHAYDPPGLAAAAIAATLNRGVLLYDASCTRRGTAGRAVEWLLRWRVDALTGADSGCAGSQQRRFGVAPLVVGTTAEAAEQKIDDERLLLLYHDMLGIE